MKKLLLFLLLSMPLAAQSNPCNATPLNTSAITATDYLDTTDAIGTTYCYTACAVGTGGVLSPPSPEVQAQTPVPPNSPTAPSATII